MKSSFLKVFIGIIWCALSLKGFSQIKQLPALEQRLQGKTNFYDVQAEVKDFFKEEIGKAAGDTVRKRSLVRQLKFWNRWLYWAESHLDKSGAPVTNSAERAFTITKRMGAGQEAARSAFGDWSFRGPNYAPDGVGRVNRLAFHPANANIIYAGTSAGGLWRLTWAGSSYVWVCLTNYIPELSISGIVVSHADANTIYILTGDGDALNGLVATWGYRGNSIGVLKSTDGGSTWFQTAAFPGVSGTILGFSLRQDPNNANVLLAATNRGVFRTANGGNSWQAATFSDDNGNLPNDNIVFDIEFKPGSSSVIYAAYQKTVNMNSASFFKSTNGGVSFGETSSFSNVNRMGIAVTPANNDYVYLVCGPGFIEDGDASDNRFNGFFYSNDEGESFDKQTETPDILGNITPTLTLGHQSGYDLAIAAASSNASIVMVGGLVVWGSTNKGVDFNEMTDYWPSDPDDDDCIHPDVHDLAYNPLDGRLYAATDGGVSVSSDHGDNFTTLFNGMQIGQFYHFEPANEDGLIWGGTQDCGVLLQESGTSFELYRGGDGYDVLTDKIGNNDDSYDVVNTTIYDDSPAGFNDITPASETEFFPLLAMHPTDEDILYAGYTNSLYRSMERGDNWQVISGTTARWALTSCPSNSSRVYCAGSRDGTRGLQRVDGITTSDPDVQSLNPGLFAAGYPDTRPRITSIAVNPSNSAQVWITVGGFTDAVKVFYSANAGEDWENRSGSLPNVPATAIITDASGNTYLGTDIGVYYRNNSMTDWTPFYNGLPRVAVSELAFHTVANVADPSNPFRYVYAATFGRGIWRSEIFSSCTSTLNITEVLQGQQFFQASNSITSSSQVNAGLGTEIYFQGGNSVTLTPGFEAQAGTLVQSYIRPCNTGPLNTGRAAMFNEQDGRMMNSEAEAFGKIVSVDTENVNAILKLKINEPGNYTIRIVNEAGVPVKTVVQKTFMKSQATETVGIGDMKKGFYHFQLLYNDRVVHFQELVKE